MWCSRCYSYKNGEYKDVGVDFILPEDLSESEYITITFNKLNNNLLVQEFNITHFRLYLITTPNTYGIPQTKYIKIS